MKDSKGIISSLVRGVIALLFVYYIIVKPQDRKTSLTEPTKDQDYEKYRLNSIVLEDGNINMIYNYNIKEVEKIMRDMSEDQFISHLSKWEYSNKEDLNTPYDTIEGKSNCQGITMFIVDWLMTNKPTKDYNYDINIVEGKMDIEDSTRAPVNELALHMYLHLKPLNGSLQVIDLSRDKIQGIQELETAIETYLSTP